MAEIISVERSEIKSITVKLSREEAELLRAVIFKGAIMDGMHPSRMLRSIALTLEKAGVGLADVRVKPTFDVTE